MNRKVNPLSQFLWALVLLASCTAAAADGVPKAGAAALGYRVVAQYPHDSRHFTQGLELQGDRLLESTGGYGSSALYIKDRTTGRVLKEQRLPPAYFGEGATWLGNRIFMLTWRELQGFVFDADLKERGRFPLKREGWGLTRTPGAMGERLLLSDGSSTLHYLDPLSLQEVGHLDVSAAGAPVEKLNELEYAKGRIFANVWQTTRIAVIAPDNGRVEKWLDLAGLLSLFHKPDAWRPDDHVLNGIAYDTRTGHLWVTGKCWPVLFEIELEDLARTP